MLSGHDSDIETDAATARPRFLQIADDIRGQIARKELKEHDILPSERSLSEQYGVSRMTGRRALEALETEGLVYSSDRRGRFVSPQRLSYNVSNMVSFVSNAQASNIDLRIEVIDTVETAMDGKLAARLGQPEGCSVTAYTRLFHTGDHPIFIETEYLVADRFPGFLRHDLRQSTTQILETQYQTSAATGDIVIRMRGVQAHEAQLLGISASHTVIELEQVIRDADGVPFCFGRQVWRGEMAEFSAHAIVTRRKRNRAMSLADAAPERGFQNTEFEARTAKAQSLMARDGLAGLLLMSEQDVRYFTGFHTLFWQSPTRPWFVFVPASGKPVAIVPEIGAELMRRSWIDDIRTWSAPNPEDDGISLLTELLVPLAKDGARVGVMKGHETKLQMPLGDWERLVANLDGIAFADVTRLVQGLRMVKSPAEIEKLSHICAIGSAAFGKVPDLVGEGMPLEEVFRQFRLAAIGSGADDAPYVVGAADQGGYADVISPPSRRPLQKGDVLMLDTGCTWDGYFCDFDRNWAIGYAHEDAKRAYDVLWRATQAGIDAARPGNTCRDLFLAMSKVIAEMDSSGGDIGRLGHGLGMQLTEQPSHAAFDQTELKENMVLTLEPSLSYGDGLMMVHEENIVVTSGEAKLLTTRAAPDLILVG